MILYRTPNVVIEDAEWHASVELRDGRVRRHFRFRRSDREMWQPIAEWKGHLPKALRGRAFQAFRLHMLQAERSVVENARALRVQGRAA